MRGVKIKGSLPRIYKIFEGELPAGGAGKRQKRPQGRELHALRRSPEGRCLRILDPLGSSSYCGKTRRHGSVILYNFYIETFVLSIKIFLLFRFL